MPRAVAALAGVLLTLLLVTAGSSQTPAPPSTPALSITTLVDQTIALFPHASGDVVEVQGETLTVGIGRNDGAQPGLVLEVVREGREIKHPKTGAVLGRAEEPLGRAVITQVFDGFSLATADRGAAIKPGDRARTSTARVKLALLPLRAPSVRDGIAEAATNEIYEALNRSGRFQLSSADQIGAWMTQENIAPEEFAAGRRVREALQRFKVDHLLLLSYTMVERKPYVDARVFAATRNDAAMTTAFFVPPSIKAAPKEQFSSGKAAPPPEKKQSLLARLLGIENDRGTYSAGEGALALKEIAKLNFATVGLDVAVAPADRIPRLVVSDGDKVFVYKIVNRTLQGDWTYSGFSIGRIVSVQFADLTGDGTLSVVANRFDSKVGMNSFIVGAKNGKPVVYVDQVDSILYAFDERGTGVSQTLWAQRYREDGFFTPGQADRMILRKGSLVREGGAAAPEGFRATGATFSNIAGKTSRGVAYIDAQNRLRINSGTEEIWRSSTPVGGGGVRVEVVRQIERGGRSYFYQLEPTPLAVDLDGDGVQEIVVPQNKDEDGVVAVIFRTAAGIRFQQVRSGFEGVIRGFGAVPAEDGGTPALITAVVRYNSILRSRGETQIIMTTSD